MEIIEHYHQSAAILIARVFLGFLFLFQGYDAVIKIGLNKVIDTYQQRFDLLNIPRFMTLSAAIFTSYTALVSGVLLVLGLFEYLSLYLLGVNLIITGVGFGMNEPLWNTRHAFTRLVLLLLLLITPTEWHHFSLDYVFFK